MLTYHLAIKLFQLVGLFCGTLNGFQGILYSIQAILTVCLFKCYCITTEKTKCVTSPLLSDDRERTTLIAVPLPGGTYLGRLFV